MKKIKFMLFSLALLAVVGGTLAFKAKYNVRFCTTKAAKVMGVSTCVVAGTPLNCPTSSFAHTTIGTDLDPDTYYCTTIPFIVNGQPTCSNASGVTTTCGTPTWTTVVGDGL